MKNIAVFLAFVLSALAVYLYNENEINEDVSLERTSSESINTNNKTISNYEDNLAEEANSLAESDSNELSEEFVNPFSVLEDSPALMGYLDGVTNTDQYQVHLRDDSDRLIRVMDMNPSSESFKKDIRQLSYRNGQVDKITKIERVGNTLIESTVRIVYGDDGFPSDFNEVVIEKEMN